VCRKRVVDLGGEVILGDDLLVGEGKDSCVAVAESRSIWQGIKGIKGIEEL